MLFTWIYVWVAVIFIAAFARLFVAVVTSAPKKKDGRGEIGKPKTERRTSKKQYTSTAQDADAFGLALSHDRSASGLPKWQRYYGNATDWE